MNNELIIKKCVKCGATIKVIEDCTCEKCSILCCGEPMKLVEANCTDAAIEKHIPTYKVEENKIIVKVNHVMEEEHFIKWICLKTESKEEYVELKQYKEAVAIFKKVPNGTLYAYCNKHGLWKTEIDI